MESKKNITAEDLFAKISEYINLRDANYIDIDEKLIDPKEGTTCRKINALEHSFFGDIRKEFLQEENKNIFDSFITEDCELWCFDPSKNVSVLCELEDQLRIWKEDQKEKYFYGSYIEEYQHAFLLKIEKNKENQLKFIIYNTLPPIEKYIKGNIATYNCLCPEEVKKCFDSKISHEDEKGNITYKLIYQGDNKQKIINLCGKIKVEFLETFDQSKYLPKGCVIAMFANLIDCLEKEQNEGGLKEKVYNIFKTKIEKLEKKKPFNKEDPNKTLKQQQQEEEFKQE